jgi:ubiquinone biosynthesis protein Coq4
MGTERKAPKLVTSTVGAVRALRGMARLIKDPTRLDEVFQIAEGFETPERAAEITKAIGSHPQHAAALRDRPRTGHVQLESLARSAPGTLGRAVHDELKRMGIDPKDMVLPEVRNDFDYVRAHMRETHDIWHVVTGFDTDVAGELGLQAFYFAQFRAPLPPVLFVVGFLNTVLYSMDDGERRMRAIVRGWLLGRKAKTLFGVRWAELWDTPLAEVRRRYDVDIEGVEAAIERFDSSALATRAWTQRAA